MFSFQKSIVLHKNRRPDLKDLENSGKALTEKTGSPEWQENVAVMHQKYNTLEIKLHEREDFMERVVRHIVVYTTNTKNVERFIPKVKEEIASLPPISTEPEVVQEQLQHAEQLQSSLVDERVSLDGAQEAADWLTANCDSEPLAKEELKARVRVSKEAIDELMAVNNERQNALKCALMQSKEFKAASNDFLIWLNGVEDRLASQSPVTSDTDSIRELKKDHVVRFLTKSKYTSWLIDSSILSPSSSAL